MNNEKDTSCEHDFKRYKKTLNVDNDAFTEAHPDAKPYLIVEACPKCKTIRRVVDYKLVGVEFDEEEGGDNGDDGYRR